MSRLQSVIRKLKHRGINLSEMRALEVFGCDGDGHVKDYASRVSDLDIWDISPGHRPALVNDFPKASVRICDAYVELKSPSKPYDLIVIDNSPVYPPHIEHFDLFPYVLDSAAPRVVFILNVIPQINKWLVRSYPTMLDPDVLACRKKFYDSEDGNAISLDRMVATYERMFRSKGFSIDHWFVQRRNKMVSYLTLIAHKEGS